MLYIFFQSKHSQQELGKEMHASPHAFPEVKLGGKTQEADHITL